MKLQIAATYKYIDSETGAEQAPPEKGEYFISAMNACDKYVLMKSVGGDGGITDGVYPYPEIKEKFGL